MQIIEYFTSDNPTHWLQEIERCEWGAGQFLAECLREHKLKRLIGETALLLLLVDGDRLLSFCTLSPVDDIQPTTLSPWVGFVYTFPAYRGHHYAGKLLEMAECLATVMGREAVYISTNHIGLYEKYGYEFFRMEQDIHGEPSRVYRKALTEEGEARDARMERGSRFKAEIVAKARQGVDPVAVCGFSCNHCFLGQWCGGCRSVFCCCSYGTLEPLGKCPNVACCEQKGFDGCYDCPELEACTVGFYQPDNDGANAAKAQALFVRKYGKEALFVVHDRLHQRYDFSKTQEILGKRRRMACGYWNKPINRTKQNAPTDWLVHSF